MATLSVNPTRMELTRLKKRLRTAKRGHRLLKDKRDELMKQFLDSAHRARTLRRRTEADLSPVYASLALASAEMGMEAFDQALLESGGTAALETELRNIMSVRVPVFTAAAVPVGLPYGFLRTSGDLDDAVLQLKRLQPELLALASLEKSLQLMALEIEKTRRRVNALEYVVIPQLSAAIRTISLKLDENERGNVTRLMKVKDMLLEQARRASDHCS